jgi:hypothetical protein
MHFSIFGARLQVIEYSQLTRLYLMDGSETKHAFWTVIACVRPEPHHSTLSGAPKYAGQGSDR